MSSYLGRLVRESREAQQWSQNQLRDRLRLARPISISKWERGEAPVPVHHWLDLMAMLKIPRERFVEAARKDQHRQLSIFLSLSRSVHDSASEIGTFTWEFIVKTLAPQSAARLEALRARYQDLTPVEFVKAAWEHFVEESKAGLDRNNQPIRLGPTTISDGRTTGSQDAGPGTKRNPTRRRT